jgi:ribose transport system permease protein
VARLGFERFSSVYLWGLFIVVFGVWTPHLFLTVNNVHSIASAQAIAAILSLAVLVPLVAGEFDLSVGATINFTAVLVAQLQSVTHWSIAAAIVASVGAGLLIGLVNGFFVVVLGVSSFITTLGTTSIITAFTIIVTGNEQATPPTSSAWSDITQYQIFGFQVVFLYMIVVAFLMWWFLAFTPAGRYLYAIGGNREAARLVGINVKGYTWLALIMSATISGIAGILYSSLDGPSLTFGAALLLPAFAGAFLGATQVRPGVFNVWGTLLAIYVLATGIQGLEFVTGVQWLSSMFNGVALVAAVSFAVWAQRQRTHASREAVGSRPATDPSTHDFQAGPTDSAAVDTASHPSGS